jgi:peptidyl-prolyl cis-trans isomerase C
MKRDLTIALIAVGTVLVACYAVAAITPDFPLSPSEPYAPAGTKAKGGKIVMHVNGEPITENEFVAFAENAPQEQRPMLLSTGEGRRLLANELVKLKALEQEAQRLGVANEPEVRTQLAMVRAQIMAGRALERLVKNKVEENVKKAYEQERANTISLRHVLVAYQGGQIPPREGNAGTADEAMNKARQIAARIRGGAEFGAVARETSDDQQTAANGGSLGATRREMLPPDVAAAVSKLQPGQVSDPVRTQFGVHVFRIDAPSLDDLRPALTRQAQQQAVEDTVAKLQKEAKVQYDDKYFAPSPGRGPAPQLPRRQPQVPRSNG